MTESNPAPAFVPGLALSRAFFREAVEPLLDEALPELRYGAALIGDGSDVLGFDDRISADHDWGPRVLLFLPVPEYGEAAQRVVDLLEGRLPERFRGWPVRFPDPDRPTRVDAALGAGGSRAHAVEIYTLQGWSRRQLGEDLGCRAPAPDEWRRLDEQKLLSATAGEVFRDDDGELGAFRGRLRFFPIDLRLERMADLWAAAAGEMPFVGRAGHRGDEIGSRLIAARQVERAMRLCFLIDGRYAPYSKWFGTAWASLPSASAVRAAAEAVLSAATWGPREAALAELFSGVARRHLDSGLPGSFEIAVANYFTRPYRVIDADAIAAGIRREVGTLRASAAGMES